MSERTTVVSTGSGASVAIVAILVLVLLAAVVWFVWFGGSRVIFPNSIDINVNPPANPPAQQPPNPAPQNPAPQQPGNPMSYQLVLPSAAAG